MTDQEFVRSCVPGAALRMTRRRGGWRWRIKYMVGYRFSPAGQLLPLWWSRWCKTPERAWRAAKQKIIHRALTREDE